MHTLCLSQSSVTSTSTYLGYYIDYMSSFHACHSISLSVASFIYAVAEFMLTWSSWALWYPTKNQVAMKAEAGAKLEMSGKVS